MKADYSEVSDEDGIGTIRVAWQRSSDGSAWTNYRQPSEDGLIALGQEEVGYAYRAIVSYVDAYGTPESLVTPQSSMILNTNDPTLGKPVIAGDLRKGSRLLAVTDQLSDRDGIASIRAKWEVSTDGLEWDAAADAGDQGLLLTQGDVGKVVRVNTTVIDRFGNESRVFSEVSAPIENVNSAPAGLVRIIATDS